MTEAALRVTVMVAMLSRSRSIRPPFVMLSRSRSMTTTAEKKSGMANIGRIAAIMIKAEQDSIHRCEFYGTPMRFRPRSRRSDVSFTTSANN